jgi:hypothetical protein
VTSDIEHCLTTDLTHGTTWEHDIHFASTAEHNVT